MSALIMFIKLQMNIKINRAKMKKKNEKIKNLLHKECNNYSVFMLLFRNTMFCLQFNNQYTLLNYFLLQNSIYILLKVIKKQQSIIN